jgi:hypothetical protein
MGKLMQGLPWFVCAPLLGLLLHAFSYQAAKAFGFGAVMMTWPAVAIFTGVATAIAATYRLARPRIYEWRFRRLIGRH